MAKPITFQYQQNVAGGAAKGGASKRNNATKPSACIVTRADGSTAILAPRITQRKPFDPDAAVRVPFGL